MVHAHPMRSPKWATERSTKRAKRSGASSASNAPRVASHLGLVKWWKVTTGTIAPLVTSRADPPVVVERAERELAFGGLDPAPLERNR